MAVMKIKFSFFNAVVCLGGGGGYLFGFVFVLEGLLFYD